MNRRLKHLTPIDRSVVAIGLLIVVLLQMMPPKLQKPTAYASENLLEMLDLSARPETDEAAKAFEDFQKKHGYFGAFALGDEGGFGWSDNYSSQAFADRSALEFCAAYGQDCRIIARLRPEQATTASEQPLSLTQAKALDDFGSWPGYKAIALSGHGGWGGAWNHANSAAAQITALENCRSNLEKHRSKTVPAGDCALLWVR